jgi:hypothetical protein
MKMRTAALLGFALTVSGYSFTSAPASAVEVPSVAPIVKGGITRVEGERERRERCERVRRECRERHHEHEREYRECVERDRCEP